MKYTPEEIRDCIIRDKDTLRAIRAAAMLEDMLLVVEAGHAWKQAAAALQMAEDAAPRVGLSRKPEYTDTVNKADIAHVRAQHAFIATLTPFDFSGEDRDG